MKTLIRSAILLLALSLFACAPKERAVEPSDGKNPVEISNPQMVIDDGHTYVFYIRNGEPVRAEQQADGSLSEPVYVDETKWLSFLESETTLLPEVNEDTKAAMERMPNASEAVPTPDNERLFFTAYCPETGKRELYWIRNGGILPVRLSQDDWWADFSVPFGFLEADDQAFSDGSKAYVALCVVTDHWSAGELCAVYMDGRTEYKVLTHENTLLRDSLSRSVMVGKAQMTTTAGSVVHYVTYERLDAAEGEHPVHITYLEAATNASCVGWNETALKNALAGEYVVMAMDADFSSPKDQDDFETYIHANF